MTVPSARARSIRRFVLPVISALAVAVPTVVAASSPPVAPTEADGAVIAQSLVEFPAGTFRWTSEALDLATPYEFAGSPPTFVLAGDGGSVHVRTDALAALLSPQSAVFVRAGSNGSASAPSAPATAWRITFEGASGGFEPGAGERDVDLVRYALTPGDGATIESALPAYVMVLEGSVVVGNDTIAAGEAREIEGGASLANTGFASAVAVVGTIGAPFDAAGTPVPDTTTPTADTLPATTAPGGGTTTAPPTTSGPTTTAAPADRPPVANDDSASGKGVISINVLANDDLGVPPATITAVLTGDVGEPIGVGTGEFVLQANGTATYTPTFSDIPSQYNTTYTITNSEGSSTGTIMLSNVP